ncbi:hypothetical protein [Ammoniphilus sp. YIM 78166]|uniref:hypothetical protein n=1 Tax=Ammoniphilus sp. YIM 78166 TaxID=1644106 RepID=UPI00106FF762|nr:hypothetical protein [Ammoniphilus sp. YIM 78166]
MLRFCSFILLLGSLTACGYAEGTRTLDTEYNSPYNTTQVDNIPDVNNIHDSFWLKAQQMRWDNR